MIETFVNNSHRKKPTLRYIPGNNFIAAMILQQLKHDEIEFSGADKREQFSNAQSPFNYKTIGRVNRTFNYPSSASITAISHPAKFQQKSATTKSFCKPAVYQRKLESTHNINLRRIQGSHSRVIFQLGETN